MMLAAFFKTSNQIWRTFCFSKLGQNFSQAKHLKARTSHGLFLLFQDVEHLYDFQTIGYVGIDE